MTGVALAHCILGKFLGVVCHCFPPPLDVPTFAASCLYVRNDARDTNSERWNCGREIVRQFCLNSDFHINLGIFYMPQIYDMGPTTLLPLRRKACWIFFRPKNPTASAGFEPANLGTKGQHNTPRPPTSNKSLSFRTRLGFSRKVLSASLILFMLLALLLVLLTDHLKMYGKGCKVRNTQQSIFSCSALAFYHFVSYILFTPCSTTPLNRVLSAGWED